jgi:hypothetical protein
MQVLNQRCVRISRSSCARESRKPAQVYAQVQKTACTLYTYIIHVYRSLQYRPVVGPLPIPSISPDSPAKLDPDPSPTRKTRDFVSFCLFLVFDILHGKKESRWTRPVDSGRGNSLRHPPPPPFPFPNSRDNTPAPTPNRNRNTDSSDRHESASCSRSVECGLRECGNLRQFTPTRPSRWSV